MLTIERLHTRIPNSSNGNYVHPFYVDSIRNLFSVNVETSEALTPTRNRTVLVSLLHDVLKKDKKSIDYFFDIRLQEELGSPSPQYELLADLGLTSVTPISIQGTDLSIVYEGFSMAESLLNNGRKALISVANLACAEWQTTKYEFACAILVSSNGMKDSKIYMKGFIQNGKN
jgi:hypothetical protein